MAASLRLSSYYIVTALLVSMLTLYYVFNLKSTNTRLARDLKFYQESLAVSKEKNKELVRDFQKKLDGKERRIRELDQDNLAKHNALGSVQSNLHQLEKNVKEKGKEIRELHRLASSHKGEISNLKHSVSKSKEALAKLSDKAKYLMSNHTQLIKENDALSEKNTKLQNEVNQHRHQGSSNDKRIQELITKNRLLNRNVEDLIRKNKAITESIKQKIKEDYSSRTRQSGAAQHAGGKIQHAAGKIQRAAGKINERRVVNSQHSTTVTPDNESLEENKKSFKRTASDADSIEPDVVTSEPSSQVEQQSTTTESTSEGNIVKREAFERNDVSRRDRDEAVQAMGPTTEDTENMMRSLEEQTNLDHA